MIDAVIAFVCMAALDYVWARYVMAVRDKRPFEASGWAAAITLFNGVFVLMVVTNWWLLFPAAVGAFVGTYFAATYGGE